MYTSLFYQQQKKLEEEEKELLKHNILTPRQVEKKEPKKIKNIHTQSLPALKTTTPSSTKNREKWLKDQRMKKKISSHRRLSTQAANKFVKEALTHFTRRKENIMDFYDIPIDVQHRRNLIKEKLKKAHMNSNKLSGETKQLKNLNLMNNASTVSFLQR